MQNQPKPQTLLDWELNHAIEKAEEEMRHKIQEYVRLSGNRNYNFQSEGLGILVRVVYE